RLQSASFNNHLEAFRRCIATSYAAGANNNFESTEQKSFSSLNPNDILQSIAGFQNGTPNIEALTKLFQGMGSEFLLGSAVGAVVMTLVNTQSLGDLFKQTDKEGE
ncbi:MAG: hypothetical protein Q7S59_02915, partial [Sulfurimonas sp.]|nr:hypothetical protein [Sulfurimonas sp.]